MAAQSTGAWKRFLNLVAFIAVALIGVALLIAKLAPSIASAFELVAHIMAYIVVAFYAFIYAWTRSRKGQSQLIHLIIWAVAVVLIVVLIIIR